MSDPNINNMSNHAIMTFILDTFFNEGIMDNLMRGSMLATRLSGLSIVMIAISMGSLVSALTTHKKLLSRTEKTYTIAVVSGLSTLLLMNIVTLICAIGDVEYINMIVLLINIPLSILFAVVVGIIEYTSDDMTHIADKIQDTDKSINGRIVSTLIRFTRRSMLDTIIAIFILFIVVICFGVQPTITSLLPILVLINL